MSLFTTIKKRYAQVTPKQFIATGVFAIAFAAAIVGGFASRQSTFAADQTIRDCQYNSIDNKNVAGGCGALTPNELCLDMWTNLPSDLQTIYNEFGFQSSDCDTERFQNEGRHGVITTSGNVVVDGQVVMTDAWTMGRTTLGGAQRTPYVINGVTYYHSPTQVSLARDLDVLVLFDADGTMEFGVMESCGNPVTRGNKVKSGGECKGLNKFAVENKKNTYQFSAVQATTFGLAKVVKYHYSYNDGSGWKEFDSTSNAGDKTKEIEFTKASKVKVEVEISLPGGKTKRVSAAICEKEIGIVKEEFLHVCEALLKTQIDTKTFRFNVVAKHSNNVKVVSADFTLDNTVTAKGVTTDEDKNGHIDRTYAFTDNKAHSVSAVINFLADGKVVQSKESCVATTDKTPECKPGIPEGDDRCKDFCKPGIPVGDVRCQELPKTGAGSVAGLFAGISAAGAVAHRMFTSRRRG